MTTQPPSNILQVQQGLFGYDDGHRLLAASAKLPDEANSLLLLLSDLAPGINLNALGGYWTGLPLPSAKYYALLRTWPAVDISRPGCVWTHVLLVGLNDMARLPDLGALRTLARAPEKLGDYDAYRSAIGVDLETLPPTQQQQGIAAEQALRLLRAFYRRQESEVVGSPGELDDAVFALWSQQWPRLRRAFTFRTASSKLEKNYPGMRFDLRLLVATDYPPLTFAAEMAQPIEAWESVAVKDLCSPVGGEFRRFLWRYGSDLQRGRDRFQTLAELYVMAHGTVLQGQQLIAALKKLATELPDSHDALTLKEDFVSCGTSKYSQLPPGDVLDMLAYFANFPKMDALPMPPIELATVIGKYWQTRRGEILAIGEQLASHSTSLGSALLSNLATQIDPDSFLTITQNFPNLRKRLVALQPELLTRDNIGQLAVDELLSLLSSIPEKLLQGVGGLFDYLLEWDNAALAREMLRSFPDFAIPAAIEKFRCAIEADGPALPSAWQRELALHRSALLAGNVIATARSTKFLAALAKLLGHDSEETLSVGPEAWIAALRDVKDDVKGSKRQTFLVFLLALACHKPVSGVEVIFELAFQSVYDDLSYAKLPEEAMTILHRRLPSLIWWENWDICERLCVAVANAYCDGNLDTARAYRLTPYKYERRRLMAKIIANRKKKRSFSSLPDPEFINK